jgi:hypothetical protein
VAPPALVWRQFTDSPIHQFTNSSKKAPFL